MQNGNLLRSSEPYSERQGGRDGNSTEADAESGGETELSEGKEEKKPRKAVGKTKASEDVANVMPNPIT